MTELSQNGQAPAKAPKNATQGRIEPFKGLKKPTCPQLVLSVLLPDRFLMLKEIGDRIEVKYKSMGYTCLVTAISARFRDNVELIEKTEVRVRPGKNYKEYKLKTPEDNRPHNWGYVKAEGSLF